MLQVYKKLFSYLNYMFLCIKQNVISSFANKKSFIVQTVMMFINNFVWLLVWLVLFDKAGDNINGVTLKDILYLWSLPVISFGIVFFCFGGVEDLSHNIAKGNLDVYLTQPKFSLIGLLTSNCKVSALGDILYGLVLGLFATNFNILDYIFLIILAIFASSILLSIIAMVHMISFWAVNIARFANIYTNSVLITLTIYPEKMYNTFTKVLIYTIAPVFYCTFLPISIGTSFNIIKLLIFLTLCVIFLLLTSIVYKNGLKRYESGNGFNLR